MADYDRQTDERGGGQNLREKTGKRKKKVCREMTVLLK